ncbi:hypothetical protein ACWGI8_17475 [Streptomyces sp. NPDC054841]
MFTRNVSDVIVVGAVREPQGRRDRMRAFAPAMAAAHASGPVGHVD